MDSQSEWILLRRVYAFLKSRNLKATAYALEKEAGLKWDIRHMHSLFEKARWRRADEYMSAFMRGREGTPDACGILFPIRIQRTQRLVRALKRGDRTWADRYRFCLNTLTPWPPSMSSAGRSVPPRKANSTGFISMISGIGASASSNSCATPTGTSTSTAALQTPWTTTSSSSIGPPPSARDATSSSAAAAATRHRRPYRYHGSQCEAQHLHQHTQQADQPGLSLWKTN